MPTYQVRPGECLTVIAARHGFHDWRTVYNHPQNDSLRAKRPDPNLLHPGDEIFIPEPQAKTVTIATGKQHTFVVQIARKRLKVVVRDEAGEPLANEPYVLELDNGQTLDGQTDGDGLVDLPVPWRTTSGRLHVCGLNLDLGLAALNPLKQVPDEGISGVQARLTNLGFEPGPIDGVGRPELRDALCSFQILHDLPVTGAPDHRTLQKLEEVHGC